MANIITNAKIVKKNSNEAKAIEVQEKTIIITLQLSNGSEHQTFI